MDINEGEPIRVERIELTASTSCRPQRALQDRCRSGRAAAGSPAGGRDTRSRAERAQGRRLPVRDGAMLTSGRRRPTTQRLVLRATPGTLAHYRRDRHCAAKSVGENVVRRQLTFKPGDSYHAQGTAGEPAASCTASSCSSSPMSNRWRTRTAAARSADARHRRGGKHRRSTSASAMAPKRRRARDSRGITSTSSAARVTPGRSALVIADRGVRADYTSRIS